MGLLGSALALPARWISQETKGLGPHAFSPRVASATGRRGQEYLGQKAVALPQPCPQGLPLNLWSTHQGAEMSQELEGQQVMAV